jgi:hypothetical protein
MITGKSWIVYFGLSFRFLIEVAILTVVLCIRHWIIAFLSEVLNRKIEVDSYIFLGYALLMLISLGNFIYRISLMRSVSFKVGNDGVTFRSGVLPWKKQEFFWSYDQLFRTTYGHSFLGWLFNYGHIILIDSKGITSISIQYYIHDAKELVGQVNYNIMQRKS